MTVAGVYLYQEKTLKLESQKPMSMSIVCIGGLLEHTSKPPLNIIYLLSYTYIYIYMCT